MKPNSAHGGDFWKARTDTGRQEIGTIWTQCGADSEYKTLRRVLLHKPGPEIEGIDRPEPVLWNALPDPKLAREQHEGLAQKYRDFGIEVNYLQNTENAPPNLYFVRDLFVMTPEGAILTRLASAARAGEEKFAARTLANLGIPLVMSVHSDGIFEGADLEFVDESLVFIGIGIRTNESGARQVATTLKDMGIDTVIFQTTYGCGHIDGVLSIIDRKKAVVYPTRLSYMAYSILKDRGFTIIDLPDMNEAETTMAINMVPLAPSCVLMPAGNTKMRRALEEHDVECHEVEVSELMKGGGSVHCMTGILQRDMG
ncbi:MAG TPA: arginine deiminase family protein [Armatimonadota bacterium]|nr:arginine deiminase family protein [Armatimonadota bacterium]